MMRLVRSPEMLWRMVDDRVLVRAVGGSPFDLVGTSAMVWIALDSPAAVVEVQERIAEVVLGVPLARVAEAISHLCKLGLLSETT